MPPHRLRGNDQPVEDNLPAGNNPPVNNPLANNPTIALICTKEYTAINRLPEQSHLTDDNWYDWKERMNRVFTNCDITGYIDGTILQVAPDQDGIGARNWVKNNSWAQQVIMDNVSTTQMNHIHSKRTGHTMYEGLASTHEDMTFYTVNNVENLLQTAKASDGDDLLKHLDTLKGLCDHMNEFPNSDFHLPDVHFKTIISNSLPRSWRSFVEPYMGNAKNANDPDPKRRIQSDTFIGILHKEYKIQKENERRENGNSSISGEANIANAQDNPGSLGSRISGHANPRAWCNICDMKGHWTSKCYKRHQNRCYNCGGEGHMAKDCKRKNGSWRGKNKGNKYRDKEKWKGKAKCKEMAEETNLADKEVAFVMVENPKEGEIELSVGDERHNFDTYQACNHEANDEHLIYYNWLADNATSSHIASERESFESYNKIQKSTVTGVGGKKAAVIGRGTVVLILNCNGVNWKLKLENVLHVPGQKNNLISLGRWDMAGSSYQGGDNRIILITKDGKRVAEGKRLNNFLYGMNVRVKPPTLTSESSQTFVCVMIISFS